MRIYSLCLIAFLLPGCAYYGDIHGDSHQIDSATLSKSHTYHKNIPPCDTQRGWWTTFKDPQLSQLITVALSDSPEIKIVATRVSAAQHLAEESRSALFPSADLDGYLQKQRFSENGLVPPPFNGETFNVGDLGVNFNYEFDFWGKNREALKAAIGEAQAAEAGLTEAKLIMASSIATLYFQLQNNNAHVHIAREKWELNKQKLSIAMDRLAHGIHSSIPTKTIQIDVESAKQAMVQFQQAELLEQHQLALLIGKNPLNTTIETTPFVYHTHAVLIPAMLPANLLANRPDIHVAQLRVAVNAHQINVAKARFFPNINLNTLFSYQSVFLSKLFTAASQNNAVTGAIDLPLFDAGQRRANLKVKYADYDAAVNEYNETILNALREVADQVTTLRTLKSQLTAQNKAVHAAEEDYQLQLILYRRGIIDYATLLDIKNNMLVQHEAQLNLQTQQLQRVVALLTALGGHDG